MLGTARAVRDSWRPDLIVREPCEYASAVAAHEAGIAQVEVGISLAAIERAVLEMVTPIIERRRPGVAEAIGAAPYVTSFPPLSTRPRGRTRAATACRSAPPARCLTGGRATTSRWST